VDTIEAIREQLCNTGVIDVTALTWGCTDAPGNDPTDLQGTLQSILYKLNNLSLNFPTQFSADFTVENVDDGSPCLGKSISLATPLNTDRLVATSVDDTEPGTLIEKLVPGNNIDFDIITEPGKLIINSSSTDTQGKVYADGSDTTLGFLDEKMIGVPGDIVSIQTIYNPATEQVEVSAVVDEEQWVINMIELINTNSELKELFCSLVASCPSPCDPPSNVQAVLVTGTTTTTTTLV
jgi:hypothetical protein